MLLDMLDMKKGQEESLWEAVGGEYDAGEGEVWKNAVELEKKGV